MYQIGAIKFCKAYPVHHASFALLALDKVYILHCNTKADTE